MTPKQIHKELEKLDNLHQAATEAADALQKACQALGEDIENFTSEKSDRWLEGETGSAYVDLASQLGEYYCTPEDLPEFYL